LDKKELKIDNSLKLYQRAVEIIPGASQTNSKRPQGFAPGAFPIYLERGEGCRVWDVDGNEYIDYIMALGPINTGLGLLLPIFGEGQWGIGEMEHWSFCPSAPAPQMPQYTRNYNPKSV